MQIAALTHLNIVSDCASYHYPVSLMEMVGVVCPEQSNSTLGDQSSVLPWVSPCPSPVFPSRADVSCCVGGCVVGGSKGVAAWELPPRAPFPPLLQQLFPTSLRKKKIGRRERQHMDQHLAKARLLDHIGEGCWCK